MFRWFVRILVLALAAGGAYYATADTETQTLLRNLPTNRSVLFWSQPTRDAAFRAMDRLQFLAKTRDIPASGKVLELPRGQPLKTSIDLDAYMHEQRSAALIIIQDGKVRYEKYGLDFSAQGRWTSFSVAKSLTSTLVGAAIKDGHIKSLDDKLGDYVGELKGSVYADVTVQQLLTMTSGVQWNENYSDPNSDVARFNDHKPAAGEDHTASYMKTLKRAHPPGTRWNYSTGETNLIGVLVSAATKKPLTQYLSEKVWTPFGMEQKATWILGKTGHEISGCCVQASTRDFARVGLFILNGARSGSQPSILPDDWIAKATTKQADISQPGKGYGYQWWTNDDGSFAARGIFGQGIFIDPKRKLVIASNGNWPKASDPDLSPKREAFYKAIQQALDEETR